MTLPISTLPLPAAVPLAFSTCTWPKNFRPSGAGAATRTSAAIFAEAPVASFTVFAVSTFTSPRAAEKYTSR